MNLPQITYLTALLIMLGYILHIGKPVILPVLIALIALYILSNVTDRLGRVPVIGRLPALLRRLIVLLAFTVLTVLSFAYLADTFTQVAAALPGYESNIDALVLRAAHVFGIEDQPTWAKVRSATIDRFQVQSYIGPVLLSLRGFGGTLFLVTLYAFFMMAERAVMARKLANAFGDPERETRTIALFVNELFDYGRPASITLVTLLDLNRRELPIQADVTGDTLQLADDELVKLTGPVPLALEIRKKDNL